MVFTRKFVFCLCVFVLIPPVSDSAFGWGERGHDLVTRIAVRHLSQSTDAAAEIIRPFSLRAHMLSHLSNVPDIVWRADYMSAQDRLMNIHTHAANLDLLSPIPQSVFELEMRFEQVKTAAELRGLEVSKNIGTAPWRVIQLQRMMSESLALAGDAETREKMVEHVNNALLVGGIMSHFVGDLANPHHTTFDRDGVLTGNAGLHYYFESAIVDAMPMDFAHKIAQLAAESPFEKSLLARYTQDQQAELMTDPGLLIFALLVDSHHNLKRLVEYDNQHSLVKRSTGAGQRAVRKPAEVAAEFYEDFAVERIAIGANVLSQLWLLAWQSAGEPDLSSYQSYEYPVRPDFIDPDYLN